MSSDAFTIVHLGLGSFHRAHEAVYLHALRESGDTRWRIVAGNLRPDGAATVDALRAQGGRYTLETVTPEGERRYERIGSIAQVVAWQEGLGELIAAAAAPECRIVSFTVTEAGYYLDAANRLDLASPDIAADLAQAREGRLAGRMNTIYGALALVLRRRMRGGAGPVTLLNCDNLRHNGDRSRAGLIDFVTHAGDAELLAWIDTHTSQPNAMVDRITPRPTPEVSARVKSATGVDDPAAVMAESFIQWVIEDRFIAGRPAWETVGVEMVDSVAPYEEAKIRLLNATHSCIAWAGTLAGYTYIHEGTHDAEIRGFAHDYATRDAIPVLEPSPLGLARYRDTVLARFGNPAILDTNQRVAMDGFSKIPGFMAPTFRERLARGQSIDAVSMLPALFLAFLARWHRGELPFAYEDQAMAPEVAHGVCESGDPAAALAALPALWGPIANDPRLVEALRGAVRRVDTFVRARA